MRDLDLDRIIAMARAAEKHPSSVGVISTGERCAVGLLCNNCLFLPDGYSFIDAFDRIQGDPILEAVLEANRSGWRE